jgi:hypothetical protein
LGSTIKWICSYIFLFVSNMEQKNKNLNRVKIWRMFSANENCDAECYRLFEELNLFSAVIPSNISNIRDMFKFIILRNLSETYHSIFILLGTMKTLLLLHHIQVGFSRLKLIKDLHLNNYRGTFIRIGYSFIGKCRFSTRLLWNLVWI